MEASERLIRAIPTELSGPGGLFVSAFAAAGGTLSSQDFTVNVGGETLSIPERLYVDARVLTASRVDPDVMACLLTRHHDGYVRAGALHRVLEMNSPWSMPFVVRLIGEYVVEILGQIDRAFDGLTPEIVQAFLEQNPRFIQLTEARVVSYWNCYHRLTPAPDYVGFRLMGRLHAASTPTPTPRPETHGRSLPVG